MRKFWLILGALLLFAASVYTYYRWSAAGSGYLTFVYIDSNTVHTVTWPFVLRQKLSGTVVTPTPSQEYPAETWSGGSVVRSDLTDGLLVTNYFQRFHDSSNWHFRLYWTVKQGDFPPGSVSLSSLSYATTSVPCADSSCSATPPALIRKAYPVVVDGKPSYLLWSITPHSAVGSCSPYSSLQCMSIGDNSYCVYGQMSYVGHILDTTAFIVSIDSCDTDFSSGTYVIYNGSAYPLPQHVSAWGTTGIVFADGHLVVGYDPAAKSLVLGPAVPKGASTVYWVPDGNTVVLAFAGTGCYYSPVSKQVRCLDGKFPVPGSIVLNSGVYPVLDYGKYPAVALTTDYYHFANIRDADGVPDFRDTETGSVYEFNSILVEGIDFNAPTAVPRGVNRAPFAFHLKYVKWPGASVSVSSISVTVDGSTVDANISSLSSDVNYVFTYGTHNICYSFSVKNGVGTDVYHYCKQVTFSYAPWDVSFAYEQNGPEVVFLATAKDDGYVAKYVWDINGTEYVTSVPRFVWTPPAPGDYNVCLSAVDNTDVATRVCGVLHVTSRLVPSGVKYVSKTTYQFVPAPAPSSHAPGAASVGRIPAVPVVLGVMSLLLLMLVVVV